MNEKHIQSPRQKRAQAVHNVICGLLRETNLRHLNQQRLLDYHYYVGVALHNMPYLLIQDNPEEGNQSVTLAILNQIQEVDITSTPDAWGESAKIFAEGFDLNLPEKPSVKCLFSIHK